MAPLGPWTEDRRVVAGVSGGADSLALALLLARWGRPLACIVDHGLRAGSAEEAARTSERLAAIGVPVRILQACLRPGSAAAARARNARYALLQQACGEAGCADLLVAHHADDQAETVRMREAAGSGPSGRAGMASITYMERRRPVLGRGPDQPGPAHLAGPSARERRCRPDRARPGSGRRARPVAARAGAASRGGVGGGRTLSRGLRRRPALARAGGTGVAHLDPLWPAPSAAERGGPGDRRADAAWRADPPGGTARAGLAACPRAGFRGAAGSGARGDGLGRPVPPGGRPRAGACVGGAWRGCGAVSGLFRLAVRCAPDGSNDTARQRSAGRAASGLS
jgi:tRNA(Ile)-lysidine synthetase-like protein